MKETLRSRLADLQRDHVPLAQHEQVVEARVAEARATAAAAERDLAAKYEEDLRVRLGELEERKQNEFAMAMLNVRQASLASPQKSSEPSPKV